MKISNEVKVGIVALLTIAAFIWLYSFLKGSELFTKTATYNIIYKEIGGLKESSPVKLAKAWFPSRKRNPPMEVNCSNPVRLVRESAPSM